MNSIVLTITLSSLDFAAVTLELPRCFRIEHYEETTLNGLPAVRCAVSFLTPGDMGVFLLGLSRQSLRSMSLDTQWTSLEARQTSLNLLEECLTSLECHLNLGSERAASMILLDG